MRSKLENSNFSIGPYQHFGRDNIYSCARITCPKSKRTALIIASKESYWGSALSKYCKTVMEAGAKHLIYAAKAGRFAHFELAHTSFIPSSFSAITKSIEDGSESSMSIETPPNLFGVSSQLSNISIPYRSGVHLSVPTVIGETKEQFEKYKAINPSTIDNEISYVAKEVSLHNSNNDDQVTFDAFHFVTDILVAPRDGQLREKPPVQLADKNEDNDDLRYKKDKAFGEITCLISEAVSRCGSGYSHSMNFLSKTLFHGEFRADFRNKVFSKHPVSIISAQCIAALIPYYLYAGKMEKAASLSVMFEDTLTQYEEKSHTFFRATQSSVKLLKLAVKLGNVTQKITACLDEKERPIHLLNPDDAIGLFELVENEIKTCKNDIQLETSGNPTDLEARQYIIYTVLLGHLIHYRGQLQLALRNDQKFTLDRREKYRMSLKSYQYLEYIESIEDREIIQAYLYRVILSWYNRDKRGHDGVWAIRRKNSIEADLRQTLNYLRNISLNSIGEAKRFFELEFGSLLSALADYNAEEYMELAQNEIASILKNEKIRSLIFQTLETGFDDVISRNPK